jgi:hypothetical protein
MAGDDQPMTLEKAGIGRFLKTLCRAAPDELSLWTHREHQNRAIAFCALIIIGGCFVYGFTIGIWRAPLMGVYAGIKLPLLIFLTCIGNGLLNAILAMALGSGLAFRQTMLCIFFSFAIFSLVVGAMSPVALFLAANMPVVGSEATQTAYSFLMVVHTFFIAYAGILGNWKLYRLLKHLVPSRTAAIQTLFAWLAGNLFLGAQLSYVLRPFFGSPQIDVQFLRDNPMEGNFYEAIYGAFMNLF